jgi:hypothetical protein
LKLKSLNSIRRASTIIQLEVMAATPIPFPHPTTRELRAPTARPHSPPSVSYGRPSNMSQVIDLGREQFAIGTINRLNLFERGCHIKTREHNVAASWEEIAGVSYEYLSKHTLNAFTTRKDFLFVFHMTNGTSIPIKFIRFGMLWGVDFIYHNHKIKKLIEALAQHTEIKTPPRGWLLQ